MYVNPKHPRYAELTSRQQAAPPEDQGQSLATLDRGRGEALRVGLAEYEGHPYVSLRVWAPGPDGELWPVKGKGCSIRVRELAEVAKALKKALDLVGEQPARRPAGNRRQPARRQPEPALMPGLGSPDPGFDEF